MSVVAYDSTMSSDCPELEWLQWSSTSRTTDSTSPTWNESHQTVSFRGIHHGGRLVAGQLRSSGPSPASHDDSTPGLSEAGEDYSERTTPITAVTPLPQAANSSQPVTSPRSSRQSSDDSTNAREIKRAYYSLRWQFKENDRGIFAVSTERAAIDQQDRDEWARRFHNEWSARAPSPW